MENQEITNFFGLISFWKLLYKLLEIFSPVELLCLLIKCCNTLSCNNSKENLKGNALKIKLWKLIYKKMKHDIQKKHFFICKMYFKLQSFALVQRFYRSNISTKPSNE